ncbi:deacylase [Reticulibacter mediterranei]|uniref:Deacylase n=1 Tax=Reticulibacter mediterranei TaxID=2778369 RepID=A0A8J3IX72_9CHLR|nr:YbaK/EbsC family protein [Reticulibacter mediterranei]GHO97711.1 deacylase [Reticulibacter mediterranei]
MKCQERLEQYLSDNHVMYQVQHHPQASTAQSIAECEHISGNKVAKSVIVLADKRPVILVLPASYRVDLDKVRTYLGTQDVRLAHEEEFRNSFPDCEVGAMPPFGNLYKLPLYVDRSLTKEETIVFPAGTHTETMSLKYADFERVAQPSLADFALRPTLA